MKVRGMVGGRWVKHSTKPHTRHGQAQTQKHSIREDKKKVRSRRRQHKTLAHRNDKPVARKNVRNELSIPCWQCKSSQSARCNLYASAVKCPKSFGRVLPFILALHFFSPECLTIKEPRKSGVSRGFLSLFP